MTGPRVAGLSASDGTLIMASVSSSAESDLLDNWLQQKRREQPGMSVDVLRLPAGPPPAEVAAHVADLLSSNDQRTVVPVRVFWAPARLPTRVKIGGLLSGRDTYRPPRILQSR